MTAGYGWGGGGIIFGNYTAPRSARGSMSHNIICENSASSHGGGLYVDGGAPACTTYVTLTNCTIANNRSSGIILDGVAPSAARVTMTNCIVWGNGLFTQIEDGNTLTAAYCIVQSAWPGAGNLVADPLFADTAGHDFHVRSTAGRWDPDLDAWVSDAVSSPAIDAGDPASEWSAEPAPNGGRINLGCYGGTAQASKSSGSSGVDMNSAFAEYFRFRCVPGPGRRGILISFALPFTQLVTLTVHNAAGREVARVVERPLASGEYRAVWDRRGLAPAVCAVRLRAGDAVMSREVAVAR